MPVSARLLYYDLGMSADDAGIVEAFTVMRTTGAAEDDLRVLVSKNFITVLNDDLVSVITDWKTNNLIRADRYRESVHKELLAQLNSGGLPPDNQWLTNGLPPGNQRLTQVSIGKVSKGKVSIVKDSCAEPEETGSTPQPENEQDVVIELPLVGKETETYPITSSAVEEWAELYPAVDILAELRKMKGWLAANPTRKKTCRGILRFVNAWLSKAQDRGGSRVCSASGQDTGDTMKEWLDDEK